ncbi:lipopolysaccharide biosynthesis protein [Deminuibacter soli]|uniref:Lipopolysaccharide biosynthesis protein n=1 Tax=Deminuibacter soli TaxID=2291815 RepID=A0A3E1NIV2_9BACT|nr:lipopolysaccharide biosynthesis protein [Deminuibacter soli]RFM27857.1 lipopolysaccharide biosynthesis protein [Deminuibacter soli]
MSQSGKLLKNALIYTVGNLGAKLLSFLMVPLYTFYLNKADLGTYDLLLTTVTLLAPFISIQMAESAYRWLLDVKDNDHNRQSTAISNSLLVFLVNNIAFTLLFAITQLFYKVPYATEFAIILFLNGLLGYLQQTARGLGLNKLYSFIGFSLTFFILVSNVVFVVVLKMRLDGILYATIISTLVAIVILANRSKIHQYIRFNTISKKEIKSMMAYAWPLIPNTISWWLINEVNRFIILFALGVDANGIFALSNRFPSIILIVNSIFMLAWQDQAIAIHDSEEKDAFYSKIFNVFLTLEFTLVIALTAVSKYVVKLVASPAFFNSWYYMPILYLSVAFASFSAFLGVGYLGSKKTKGLFTTTVYGSIINVAISYLSVRYIGLYAPCIGTCVGFVIIWVLRIRQTRAFVKLKINYTNLAVMLGVTFAVMYLVTLNNLYTDVLCILIAVATLFIANKSLLQYLYGFVQKSFASFIPKHSRS